ncbi:hypothetical protein GF327_04160 [Candidatus Woesearchaeota archaeon]|nr:hypothetical protein [Candidatus Woesearchaeota archaeon]
MNLSISPKKLIIGASYNKLYPPEFEKATENQDENHVKYWIEKNKKKAQGYIEDGLEPWNKLWRIKDFSFINSKDEKIELDQLKSLMPVDPFEYRDEKYGPAPMAMEIALPAKLLGMKVAVVGSSELEHAVNALNDFLEERNLLKGDKVVFAQEPEKPSLEKTIQKGINALNIETNQEFYFANGDIPGFDLLSAVTDPCSEKYGFYMNLCGRDVIYDDKEFFPRNWYQSFVNGFEFRFDFSSGKLRNYFGLNTIPVKEGTFSKFRNTNLTIKSIGLMYDRNRIKGVVSDLGFWKEAFHMIKEQGTLLDLLKPNVLIPGLISLASILNGIYLPRLNSYVLSKVFGYPAKIAVSHKDPFQAADIDSWQDWRDKMNWMYLARKDDHNLKETLWYGPVWTEFQKYLIDNSNFKNRISLVRHLPDYANSMAKQFGIEPFFNQDGSYNYVPQNKREYKCIIEHLKQRTKRDNETLKRLELTGLEL